MGYKQSTRKTRGSHRVWYHPETQKQTTIPDFGARDLPKGTLHAIKKQLDIDL